MNEPDYASPAPPRPQPRIEEQVFQCHVRLRDLPDKAKDVTVQARSLEEAVHKLFSQGYVVVSIHGSEKKAEDFSKMSFAQYHLPKPKAIRRSMAFFQVVTTREVIFFSIQLSTLLKAGIPLLKSLDIIQKGLSNAYFKKVLQGLLKTVSEGAPFSRALQKYPKVFPWIWANLVEVGEATGKLAECLEEIGHYQESSERIKSKMITAFFYPGILTVAVIAALTFLLIVVVPKFSEIFIRQQMTLPILTQIIINMSDILRKHFALLAGSAFVGLVGLVYAARFRRVRTAFDTVLLSVPIFGPILMQVAVVRFTRALGTMLRSGVPILQALEISSRLVENRHLEAGIKQAAQAVKGGHGLGVQLEARGIFPVFMTQLLTVGEESGQLDRFLDLLAHYYEEMVDTFLARLATLLEPFLLIFMGGVIGMVVIAMFLPIIELSTRGGG